MSHFQFANKSTAGGVVAPQKDEISALIITLRGPLQLSSTCFLVVSFPTAPEARKCQFYKPSESSLYYCSNICGPKRKAYINIQGKALAVTDHPIQLSFLGTHSSANKVLPWAERCDLCVVTFRTFKRSCHLLHEADPDGIAHLCQSRNA